MKRRTFYNFKIISYRSSPRTRYSRYKNWVMIYFILKVVKQKFKGQLESLRNYRQTIPRSEFSYQIIKKYKPIIITRGANLNTSVCSWALFVHIIDLWFVILLWKNQRGGIFWRNFRSDKSWIWNVLGLSTVLPNVF